jgi:hypothetical protein
MAVGKVGGSNPANVIRPLYGVFLKDNVANLRAQLGVTLSDLKAGIAAGDPNSPQVRGNGRLDGIELAEAKTAAKALNKAIGALKPVFGGGEFPTDAARNQMDRNPAPGGMIAMYGVFLADDLRKYKNEISNNIQTINDGLKDGRLSGPTIKEAKAALKSLTSAMNSLNALT